jgi:DNA invertase Pin-like site-specific DNA recombinase
MLDLLGHRWNTVSVMNNEQNTNENGKRFVAYYRVSTARQGESGLGLEAQRKAVADFVRNVSGSIVADFVEIESGKRADRPQLAQAIDRCKREGLTLLVAKLDRLARNVHFISALQHSKVDFLCVDNPHATPFLIHILSAVAEHEANMIAIRTRQALAAFKARGGMLGNPRFAESVQKAREAKSAKARERNGKLLAIVGEIKAKTGLSKLGELAEALNLRGIRTARNNAWTSSHVFNLLNSATA